MQSYREKEQAKRENYRNEGACFSLSFKRKEKEATTAIRIFGEMSMASFDEVST